MTFEEILPGLKAKKNMCEQDGVEQKTTSNSLIPLSKWGGSGSDPYFPINVSLVRVEGFLHCGVQHLVMF